ncbi:hypothetical protein DMC47_09020 [Nostoc sp. 3335mG]|nr:hypothetical protein DMC47_09020 [Nostoc sp. 3335mG]
MSILSLRPRAFRTRNPGRDAETDAVRLETVRSAIAMALADARREREGLQQRIDMYFARAAIVMDTSGDYGSRADADEAVIRSAEQSANHARRRVAQLDAQIERFATMVAELDGNEAAPARDSGVA